MKPFISHSEISNEIYIICGKEKYLVTEQVIKAMKSTGRLAQSTSEDCVSRAEMLKYQQYLRGKMPNEENHKLWEFIQALPPVTPTIPKGATNGDVITAMLNNSVYELEITEIDTVYCEKKVKVIGRSKEKDPNIIGGKNKPLFNCTFKADWWNAPYKSDCVPSEYDLSEDIELSNPQMHR